MSETGEFGVTGSMDYTRRHYLQNKQPSKQSLHTLEKLTDKINEYRSVQLLLENESNRCAPQILACTCLQENHEAEGLTWSRSDAMHDAINTGLCYNTKLKIFEEIKTSTFVNIIRQKTN